jgi:hypothetical protein
MPKSSFEAVKWLGLKAGDDQHLDRFGVRPTARVFGYAAVNVASTPAAVDQLPLAMVYLDSIPGMVCLDRRKPTGAVERITSACRC